MVYKVSFKMRTPVILTSAIHFDALLTAVHPMMHNLDRVTKTSGAEKVVTAPLPIRKICKDGAWVWCCSAALFPDDSKFFNGKVNKVKNGIDYFYLKAKQQPATGIDRNRCDTIYGVTCREVYFLVESANPKELERICRRVRSIGGLRRMGYGEVTEIVYEECPELTWQDTLVKDGIALRNIPAELLENKANNMIVTRPPYWLAAHRRSGVAEGEEAVIKEELNHIKFK